ncbi:hypothetical protein niasHS_013855 [Heterodera schachtii]|uniref:MFS transporter n=1 Tax=Heterodera schachtii TaxID=97005 RepID=A0ABD2IVF3_HETSC
MCFVHLLPQQQSPAAIGNIWPSPCFSSSPICSSALFCLHCALFPDRSRGEGTEHRAGRLGDRHLPTVQLLYFARLRQIRKMGKCFWLSSAFIVPSLVAFCSLLCAQLQLGYRNQQMTVGLFHLIPVCLHAFRLARLSLSAFCFSESAKQSAMLHTLPARGHSLAICSRNGLCCLRLGDGILMGKGLLEVAYGLGYVLGPVLGSVLFEIGGFGLPLYSVGLSFTVVIVPSIILLVFNQYSSIENESAVRSSAKSDGEVPPRVLQLLAIPDLFMAITSLFLNSICWYFYEPSLTTFVADFRLDWSASMLSGILIAIISAVYIASATIWTFLLQRYLSDQMRPMMLLISVGMAITMLLMGPSPLLGLPNLMITAGAFALLGFVAGAAYVPVFKWCVDAANNVGLDGTSPAICGCVSGFIQSALSLSAFLATGVGGLSAQHFGLPWTATLVAAIQLAFIVVQIIYWLLMRNSARNHSIHPIA